ncbi:MAG: hypothetical protein ACLQOO_02195 [Terriglobia bacterium]
MKKLADPIKKKKTISSAKAPRKGPSAGSKALDNSGHEVNPQIIGAWLVITMTHDVVQILDADAASGNPTELPKYGITPAVWQKVRGWLASREPDMQSLSNDFKGWMYNEQDGNGSPSPYTGDKCPPAGQLCRISSMAADTFPARPCPS